VPQVRPGVPGPKKMGRSPRDRCCSIDQESSVEARSNLLLLSCFVSGHGFSRAVKDGLMRPLGPEVRFFPNGSGLQAAEKLILLKGTAFRPYINPLQRIRL
jgi:hypothetical protein